MRRYALVAILLVAFALRAYPLHVFFLHPDWEYIPSQALKGFAAGDWRPDWLGYPTGLVYVLRVIYSAAYAAGTLRGHFDDRLEFISAFIASPYPFVLVGRVFACVLGVGTVALTIQLGARIFGPRAGLVAGFFIAVSFLHVRESHYGTLDVPTTAFAAAALLLAETYRQGGRGANLAGAGALAGAAVGFRYQLAPVGLALAAAAWLRPGIGAWRRVAHLALAVAAATAAFALLTPHALLESGRAWQDIRLELALARFRFWPEPPQLTMLLTAGSGHIVCLLAVVGLAAAGVRRERGVFGVVAFALPYALALWSAWRLYARYTIPLLPVLALFAARGL